MSLIKSASLQYACKRLKNENTMYAERAFCYPLLASSTSKGKGEGVSLPPSPPPKQTERHTQHETLCRFTTILLQKQFLDTLKKHKTLSISISCTPCPPPPSPHRPPPPLPWGNPVPYHVRHDQRPAQRTSKILYTGANRSIPSSTRPPPHANTEPNFLAMHNLPSAPAHQVSQIATRQHPAHQVGQLETCHAPPHMKSANLNAALCPPPHMKLAN